MGPTLSERAVFTYEDYKALPEDGGRWEVLEGRLCREPAPPPFHQVVVANLLHLLGDFARERALGHVLLSPSTWSSRPTTWSSRTWSSFPRSGCTWWATKPPRL